MGVNYVETSEGEVLVDLRHDTVSPDTLPKGVTAHDSQGNPIEGNLIIGEQVQADLSQKDPDHPSYVKGQSIIDSKIRKYAIPEDDKGIPGGVATLDDEGLIPVDQLPFGSSGQTVHIGGTAPSSSAYTLWIDTSGSSAVLKYKNSLGIWTVISGGGGGGGSTNNAKLTVTNKSGWLTKTISYGADCDILLEWSSIEDEISTGNGTVAISIGGVLKSVYEVEQGQISIPIDRYLTLGDNKILVAVSDLYGNIREINFTISCVKVNIESLFDPAGSFTGSVLYSYYAIGNVEKTVHFVIDGDEEHAPTETVTSNREQGFYLPELSHGNHTLEVYFHCYIDNVYVESNRLYYDLIYYEEGVDTPVISCTFNTKTVKQFQTLPIQWAVYTPNVLKSVVNITDNFGYSATQEVDRTIQSLPYKAENVGDTEITFRVPYGEGKEVTRVVSFTTEANKVDVYAETSNLDLYLNSKGRSNTDKERDPLEWSFEGIQAELTGFNLVNDGWQPDNDGDIVLRVSGDARVTIPFKLFENDFRTNGKTIEFEFATRDVLNYDADIISCWSGNRGLKVTAQKALLKSEKSEIYTQYKENEHIRITFCVEKRAKYRLLSIYLNGVLSGVKQYSDSDDFSQAEPVNISIGSNYCTTDIYCIRVYNNDLLRYQIVDNWMADTQNIERLLERYERNNIYNEYDEVVIDKLPSILPYLVIECDKLPQTADDEFDCNGYYVDPLNPNKCFTFNNAVVQKQGTSSMAYKIGNLKVKYENGFIVDGVKQASYKMRDESIGTATFTYKADVASIEGANNLQLVRLFNDTTPSKTPPQIKDSRVRQGIDGLPIVIFHDNGKEMKFMGKYNFNNDKSTREVYGFKPGDECWSVEVNSGNRVLYKDDDFSDESWKSEFESRYPKNYYDTTRLQAMVSWVKSTDRTAATGDWLEEEKEYDGTVYTHDTVEYRFAKFRNEAPTIFDIKSLRFFYLFTTFHLMADNWAKNSFPTYFAETGLWYMLPYDFDTALGINNEGQLAFGYELEDTDLLESGAFVFNAQNSVLMTNTRDCFAEEIKEDYKELRSKGLWTYEDTINRFRSHQNVWGESIFNEDMKIKHLDALYEDNNAEYLPMALGKKELQLAHWLYNRYRYFDSKYVAGDSLTDKITFRGYAVANISMTPYADIYTTIEWASADITQQRSKRGVEYTHECPLPILNETEINIYSASQLSDLGDLSPLKLGGFNDFSCATKITNLKIGDGGDYRNGNLKTLSLGNNRLLRTLDVRNCYNLADSVDLTGCTNLEYAYFEGTATTGIDLPNAGILKELSLPSTVTNLTIRNQPMLTKFTMPSYENLTTLRLENLNVDLFDTLSMILQMPDNSRVRVLGVEWTMDAPEQIFQVFERLKSYRGLDEYGNNVDKPQISGIIHVDTITGDDLADLKSMYPEFYSNFTIDFKHLICRVEFYNYDGSHLHTVYVEDGGDCYDPVEIIGVPTKPESEESKFIYSHWDKSLERIIENKVITAVYNEYRKYFVSFIDDFGNAVQVNGNDTNIYYDIEGENVISIPANLPNYSIVDGEGATWDYHFEGWSLDGKNVIEIPAVSGTDYNITYQAVFSEHRVYVVKFMNDSVIHNELHLYEGAEIAIPETPARVSTYQFDYEFAGWTLDGENIVDVAETIGTEDLTYIAKYTAIDRYYSIKFVDWNGSVLKQYSVKHDELPTCDNPTREATAEFFYDFDGWDKEVVAVTGDAVYTATYLPTLRTYTVTWVDEDGTSLLEEDVNVDYGTMPSYDGATPTKQGDAQFSYTFKGWHIEISTVTGDITYKATYTETVNEYKVIWKNEDGTPLETDTTKYGETPTYDGDEPTKASDAQFDYKFAGWDTEIVEVTGDVVYTATYTNHIRSYEIKFVDWDGTVLNPDDEPLEYGSMPIAPIPTRIGYTFLGWDNEVTTVEGEATYTAQYSINSYTIKFVGYTDFAGTEKKEIEHTLVYGATVPQPSEITRIGYDFKGWDKQIPSTMPADDVTITAQYEIKKFTIKFVNYNGDELYSKAFEYGSTPSYSGNAPTKAWTNEWEYHFAGWGTIATVTGEATYTAEYTSKKRSWTVTWKNEDGTVLKTETVEYGTTPKYSGTTPTKTATAQYTYTHNGWTPTVVAVTGNVTYTATYSSTVNKYTIKFVDWDGKELSSKSYDYGTSAEKVTKPSDPTKTGHDFTGWSPAIATVTGNATYTAQYKAQTFTIKFLGYDGSVLSTQTVEYGKSLTIPTAPSRQHYTFKGWSPAVVTTVTSNATYTAQYEATVYEITGRPIYSSGQSRLSNAANAWDSDVNTYASNSSTSKGYITFSKLGLGVPTNVTIKSVSVFVKASTTHANDKVNVEFATYKLGTVAESTTVLSGVATTPKYYELALDMNTFNSVLGSDKFNCFNDSDGFKNYSPRLEIEAIGASAGNVKIYDVYVQVKYTM